jgi:hypothetical protein
MPALKINGLINLQDARYCAALGVGYMSFSLARGHIHKLPEATAAEMIEWLSGSRVVLDFGQDLENCWQYLANYNTSPEDLFQFHYQAQLPLDELDAERLILEVPLESGAEAAGLSETLGEWAPQVHAVELNPQTYEQELLDEIRERILLHNNIILNVDNLGLETMQELEVQPPVIAMRQLIQADFTSLDYDGIEELVESGYIQTEGPFLGD